MLPELDALLTTGPLIRIPDGQDVPLTARVRRLIDTSPMRRLASISQLGMVALVYPGATHSRLEHSLGVYHNALRFLARFRDDQQFRAMVPPTDAEAFVVAALVHDIGHWPFCHPIEDMQLAGTREHEARISGWLAVPEVAACLQQDWNCSVDDVLGLLVPPTPDRLRFLTSCLSGPVDIDKLDYLQRDSLHAGVPYGRNFDAARLIRSLCIHPQTFELAVGEKGRTAAEMMVFARYVMFSEVYWHHAVRSATAMLQRAVFELQDQIEWESSFQLVESDWISLLNTTAEGTAVESLATGLFGPQRSLFKRVGEFSFSDGGELHRQLARRPYWWLVTCARQLATQLNARCDIAVGPTDVLIDAPPVKLEVDINLEVQGRDGKLRSLGEVSPVAAVLAREQFDDQVKRVRVFVRPGLRAEITRSLGGQANLSNELAQAIAAVEHEVV